jgi:hypothetical protein
MTILNKMYTLWGWVESQGKFLRVTAIPLLENASSKRPCDDSETQRDLKRQKLEQKVLVDALLNKPPEEIKSKIIEKAQKLTDDVVTLKHKIHTKI